MVAGLRKENRGATVALLGMSKRRWAVPEACVNHGFSMAFPSASGQLREQGGVRLPNNRVI